MVHISTVHSPCHDKAAMRCGLCRAQWPRGGCCSFQAPWVFFCILITTAQWCFLDLLPCAPTPIPPSDAAFVGPSGSVVAAVGSSPSTSNVVLWDALAPPTLSCLYFKGHEGQSEMVSSSRTVLRKIGHWHQVTAATHPSRMVLLRPLCRIYVQLFACREQAKSRFFLG